MGKQNKIKVSYFGNVEVTKPKNINLLNWLKSTINPPKKLKKLVELYRKSGDQRVKESLPCITVSATFKDIRNLNNIDKKTGLLCLDIDRYSKSKKAASNICIDMKLARNLFSTHPSCLYCGFSVSNDGVYAIIIISQKNKLNKYFEHFQKKLALIGINIDAACKDYTRLRFFSYDKDAYLNKKAKPYRLPSKKIKKPTGSRSGAYKSSINKIELLIKRINETGLDITSDYQDWIKIGGAISSEFGDAGNFYFHEISKHHPDYDSAKCDRKYYSCSKMNGVSFGSLFYIADSYGIRY